MPMSKEDRQRIAEKAAAIKAEKAKPVQNPPGTKKKKKDKRSLHLPQRLPHGARFDVNYDAEKEMWEGYLVVEGERFAACKSGVFRLLRILDQIYRDWKKKQIYLANREEVK